MTLSPQQVQEFAEFAQACIRVRSKADFRAVVTNHVQPLIPHGMFLAVIGQLKFDHLTVHQHIAINYPDWALSQVTQSVQLQARPILQRWLHTRTPVIVDPNTDQALMSEREIAEAKALQMGRLAIHGLADLTNRMGSYFSLARVASNMTTDDVRLLLSILTPLLHTAMLQACPEQPHSIETHDLTAIERELLIWLAAGRTNQEMAAMRQRSPATIRNQLVKLYAKLGVSTRAEAVSLAMSQTLQIKAPGTARQ